MELDPQYLGFLVDFNAASVRPSSIAPGYRVVTRDRPWRVIERAEDWRVPPAGKIHVRATLLNLPGSHQLTVHAEVFVDFSSPAHGAYCRIRMGQRKMARA